MHRQSVATFSVIFLIAATMAIAVISPMAISADANEADLQVVVVPRIDLEKGSTPTESSLEEKKIEKRLAPVTAVAGISEVVGRTLKRKKMKGAIILLDDLARPGDKLD